MDRITQDDALFRLYKLAAISEQIGIPIKSLRREISAGRLRCYRARPGSTAPILLKPADVLEWLEQHAGQRQRALRPGA